MRYTLVIGFYGYAKGAERFDQGLLERMADPNVKLKDFSSDSMERSIIQDPQNYAASSRFEAQTLCAFFKNISQHKTKTLNDLPSIYALIESFATEHLDALGVQSRWPEGMAWAKVPFAKLYQTFASIATGEQDERLREAVEQAAITLDQERFEKLVVQAEHDGNTWVENQWNDFWVAFKENTVDEIVAFKKALLSFDPSDLLEEHRERAQRIYDRIMSMGSVEDLPEVLSDVADILMEVPEEALGLLADGLWSTVTGLAEGLEAAALAVLQGRFGEAGGVLLAEVCENLVMKRIAALTKVFKSKVKKRGKKKSKAKDDDTNVTKALQEKWRKLKRELNDKVVDRRRFEQLIREKPSRGTGQLGFHYKIEEQNNEKGENYWRLKVKSHPAAGAGKKYRGWIARGEGGALHFTTASNQRKVHEVLLKKAYEEFKKEVTKLPDEKHTEKGLSEFLSGKTAEDLRKASEGGSMRLLKGIRFEPVQGEIKRSNDDRIGMKVQFIPNTWWDILWFLSDGESGYTINRRDVRAKRTSHTVKIQGSKRFRERMKLALDRINTGAARSKDTTKETMRVILDSKLVAFRQSTVPGSNTNGWVIAGLNKVFLNRNLEWKSRDSPEIYAGFIGHEITHIGRAYDADYGSEIPGQRDAAIAVIKYRYTDEFLAHKRQIEHWVLAHRPRPLLPPYRRGTPGKWSQITGECNIQLHAAFRNEKDGFKSSGPTHKSLDTEERWS